MSKKILVIESDAPVNEPLATELEAAGYQLSHIDDSTGAMPTILAKQPDLIILATDMAHGNGIAVLQEIHKNETARSIPTIVISDSGEAKDITKILELGAHEYLVRSQVEPDDVIRKIHVILKDTAEPAGNKNQVNNILKGKKILWVEDDQFLGEIIEKKFATSGLNLTHVMNGEEAVKALSQNDFDLVCLDLLLPTMDGFEVLKRMKDNEKTKNIPVVILSNLGQSTDKDKAKQLGATLFLVKAEHTLDEVLNYIVGLINQK